MFILGALRECLCFSLCELRFRKRKQPGPLHPIKSVGSLSRGVLIPSAFRNPSPPPLLRLFPSLFLSLGHGREPVDRLILDPGLWNPRRACWPLRNWGTKTNHVFRLFPPFSFARPRSVFWWKPSQNLASSGFLLWQKQKIERFRTLWKNISDYALFPCHQCIVNFLDCLLLRIILSLCMGDNELVQVSVFPRSEKLGECESEDMSIVSWYNKKKSLPFQEAWPFPLNNESFQGHLPLDLALKLASISQNPGHFFGRRNSTRRIGKCKYNKNSLTLACSNQVLSLLPISKGNGIVSQHGPKSGTFPRADKTWGEAREGVAESERGRRVLFS